MKNLFISIIIIPLLSCSGEKANTDSTEQAEIQSINQVDINGVKQGIWVEKVGSNIIDSMNFVDDKLNGIYKSYFTSGNLRHSGRYEHGVKLGTWSYFDTGVLVAEEIERGTNRDSVQHELGYYLTPEYFSYVKLYNRQNGHLEQEGKLLYSDSWQSDTSNEQGRWIYYDNKGDTTDIKIFEYGRENK